MDGTYYHFKTDVFGGIMQYSSAPNMATNLVSIPVERVKEIIALNKQGIKVESLLEKDEKTEKSVDYENVVGQDSLTRFDKKKKKKRRGNNGQREKQENDSVNKTLNQENKGESNQNERKNRSTQNNNSQQTPTNESSNKEENGSRENRNHEGKRNHRNRPNNGRRFRNRGQGNAKSNDTNE
jgi:hypothetical protein